MFKFYAFILSCLSFVFLTTPAHAGRLLFWRYEANQNRLLFTTDQGVQPTAQLIANPTRLVIDLPGTVLGRPTINESYGGVIRGLRIGQFDTRTTRLVIELAPGYVLEPEQIKIKGISPTQWSVELPNPKRGNFPSSQNNDSSDNKYISSANKSNSNSNSNSKTRSLARSSSFSGGEGLQITSSGLVVAVDGNHKNKIKVERSDDRRQINVEIEDLKVPQNLLKSWQINQYGISNLEINQTDKSVTTLTLNVNPDSPDWRATFMRTGGLLLWPQGGISRVADLSVPQANNSINDDNNSNNRSSSSRSSVPVSDSQNTPISINQPAKNNGQLTTLEYLEVDYNQLIIKSDKYIQAKANWSNGNQVYQIRLENTKLSPNFKSPKLKANSPVARLRIWEPDPQTVVLLIEPSKGTQVQRLNQLRDNLWTLSLNRNGNFARRDQRASIPITPTSPSANPFDSTPGRNISRVPIPTTPSFPRTTNRPITKNKPLVVIDPGHGGKDPGAIGIGGVQEKHVVMAISREVERILEKQGIQVRMTRNNDYFVSLQGRTKMANQINADLFVSIHANSAGRNKPHVSGYETYYFQSGRNLATVIHRNVLRRVNVRDRKVRKARFYVLRKSSMPAVLVEAGFLTGREDIAKLTNSWFQKQMAQAIAAGIIEYIQSNRL
jgi:N-acetylmuramoyl-L-alanine amidase